MEKRLEREEARELYLSGKTYNEIACELKASKSTVSIWCHDLAQHRANQRMCAVAARKAVKASAIEARRIITATGKKKILRPVVRKAEKAPVPYEGFQLYRYCSKDKIARVCLINSITEERYTLSVARFEMAIKLGRRLTSEEVVRHNHAGEPVLMNRGESLPPKAKMCTMCDEPFIPRRASVETCSKECRYTLVSMVNMRG